MLWKKKKPTVTPQLRLHRIVILFEFPRGDFFFHFLGVADVVYNLVYDCLFLIDRNFSRWQSSEKSSQFISLILGKYVEEIPEQVV